MNNINLGTASEHAFNTARLTGRKQKSSSNVAQTGSIGSKHVRIQIQPINK
jgi:hypothetical protein